MSSAALTTISATGSTSSLPPSQNVVLNVSLKRMKKVNNLTGNLDPDQREAQSRACKLAYVITNIFIAALCGLGGWEMGGDSKSVIIGTMTGLVIDGIIDVFGICIHGC
jgi:hypothetical protein